MIKLAQRFLLEREIGSGGMARVFLGRDEVLDRPVAIKILRFGFGDSDVGFRFRREGRTAARLSHPNIVQVYDAGEDEFEGRETSYIVMEYLPGGDLKDLIDEKGTLEDGELARIGEQVAAGLSHAHERGVVHRDIKPHNILLDDRGRPKLTDFGIARALDATTSHATRTGSYLGTALYSSPEQLQGEKVTFKSDVYSLGATLYQAATGEPPFTGSPISVASQHVSKPPPRPTELNAAIGGELEALILACLAKDPEDRPSASEVRSRLAEIARENERAAAQAAAPVAPPIQPTRREPAREATEAAPPHRVDRRGRRGGLLALLALLAAVAVIAAIAIPSLFDNATNQGQQPDPQPNNQQQNNQPANNRQDDQNQPPPEPTTPPEETTQQPAPAPPPEETTPPEQTEPSGGLTEEAAEQVIRDHYQVAASDDYPEAWNFLSSRYQQEIGSQEAWTNQFQTLESIEFTSGPTAQVNGDTATVSFSTRAVHTDRVDTPSPTATLVNENGEWKIDGLS